MPMKKNLKRIPKQPDERARGAGWPHEEQLACQLPDHQFLNYGYFGICYNSCSDILIKIEGKPQQCQSYNFLKI